MTLRGRSDLPKTAQPPAKTAPKVPAAIMVDEQVIECSPSAAAQTCGGCLVFLMSMTMISALGIVAAGALWSAQSLDRVVGGEKSVVEIALCLPGIASNVYLALTNETGAHTHLMEVPPCSY